MEGITVSDSHLKDIPGGDSAGPGGSGDGEKPKQISYETYEKTLNQEKSLRKRLQETQEKLLVFENEQKTSQEQKLLEEKKHLEFIEQLKREKAEALEKAERLERDQIDFRKLNAAMGLLQEKGIQLESKYLGLLPLDQIQMTDEGSIDHTSVASAVDSFAKEHPRLTLPASKFLPNDKTGNSAQKMSVEEWKKLPYKEKQEAMKAGRVNHNFKF
jgi:vacuolar-type H+-ATPase subunit I/STV1